MDKLELRGLNIKTLLSDQCIVVSSKDALIDVEPIEWCENVSNGTKKVLLVEKQ